MHFIEVQQWQPARGDKKHQIPKRSRKHHNLLHTDKLDISLEVVRRTLRNAGLRGRANAKEPMLMERHQKLCALKSTKTGLEMTGTRLYFQMKSK